MLGHLKGDVDNLGSIFVFGLVGANQNYNTIGRLVALSRLMDLFYSGWVHRTLESEYQHCYTVFSGGDDFYLIGPWNEIIEFSKRLQSEFLKYTGNNHNMTVSMGVHFSKPKEPIPKVWCNCMVADSNPTRVVMCNP